MKISNKDRHLIVENSLYFDKNSGYYQIYLNGEVQYLHRVIMGAEKGQIVDHINEVKTDNRRENLRFVTKSENNYNSSNRRRGRFGRGIYFDKAGNRYRACISYKNKILKLGSFSDVVEAKKAYNKKAKEIYGDMAYQHDIS